MPYAAVDLPDEERRYRTAASVGEAPATAHLVGAALVYQGETIGRLRVAAGRRGLGEADARLLAELARQAAIAVHGVRLSGELQRARERLVTAREEERRRLFAGCATTWCLRSTARR